MPIVPRVRKGEPARSRANEKKEGVIKAGGKRMRSIVVNNVRQQGLGAENKQTNICWAVREGKTRRREKMPGVFQI